MSLDSVWRILARMVRGLVTTRRLRGRLYCGVALYPFALPKFDREKRVGGSTHLSLTSTDPGVLGGVGGNQGSEGCSSDTYNDSISHELNKAMDIDALISSGRKRRRTSTGVAHVNPSRSKLPRIYWALFKAGSFALTNCFGGLSSLLANLSFKAESFALANCSGGRGSFACEP
ncbi:hypothetical protein GOBAR_DD32714 [Gossypium barbadense]|nr:hypothetical protein GOBAR_DD32714 [Gossypium barbadense]